MALLEIKDLNFKYSLGNNLVLKDINLEVEQGDFLVICGDSGCGKSTLIKHLKKELIPYGSYSGEVLLNNQEIRDMTLKESATSVGYVMQNPENQIVTDKVWHELAFGLENLGTPLPIMRRKVAEISNYFGIQKLFRENTMELSGGQKQLINLAATLLLQPSVLVLDEPTSQLDPVVASEFIKTLKKINDEFFTTIIIVEHRLEELMKYANKVVVMDEGRIIAKGDPTIIGNELKKVNPHHPIFKALPISMRVASALDVESPMPLSIKEGRTMLLKLLGDNPLYKYFDVQNYPIKDDPILELKDLYFRYEKEGVDILRGVNLTVNKAELYCIVGGNGSGKTTAINNIAGLLKPYRGKIIIDGVNITKKDLPAHTIGYLPQNPSLLFYEDSVIKDLKDVFKTDKDKEAKEKKMWKLIDELGIKDILDQHPYDISGGEQQKVALIKLLINEPKILLLDEPTKGLDASSKEKFAKILENLIKQDITIILISHDIDFCAEYAHRVAFFFDGNVISVDTPNNFFKDNSFYTTNASKLTKNIFDNSITYEEVISLCQKNLMSSKE